MVLRHSWKRKENRTLVRAARRVGGIVARSEGYAVFEGVGETVREQMKDTADALTGYGYKCRMAKLARSALEVSSAGLMIDGIEQAELPWLMVPGLTLDDQGGKVVTDHHRAADYIADQMRVCGRCRVRAGTVVTTRFFDNTASGRDAMKRVAEILKDRGFVAEHESIEPLRTVLEVGEPGREFPVNGPWSFRWSEHA